MMIKSEVEQLSSWNLTCKSNNKKDSRLRSSVLVHWGKKNILIDSGPDFRYQILRQEINHIDAVFYTHEHRDHVAGLDDLRSFYYFSTSISTLLYCCIVILGMSRMVV